MSTGPWTIALGVFNLYSNFPQKCMIYNIRWPVQGRPYKPPCITIQLATGTVTWLSKCANYNCNLTRVFHPSPETRLFLIKVWFIYFVSHKKKKCGKCWKIWYIFMPRGWQTSCVCGNEKNINIRRHKMGSKVPGAIHELSGKVFVMSTQRGEEMSTNSRTRQLFHPHLPFFFPHLKLAYKFHQSSSK